MSEDEFTNLDVENYNVNSMINDDDIDDDDDSDMPPLEDRTPPSSNSPTKSSAQVPKTGDDEELSSKAIDSDGWEDVLGSGRLKKKIIKEGEPNTRPSNGDTCIVELSGRLNEKIVIENQQIEFVASECEVIKAVDIIVVLMNNGETCEVIAESDFVYGDLGLEPNIPPGKSVLTLTITLLSHDPHYDITKLPLETRKAIGKRKKNRGNFWYSREDHTQAIQCYRKAVEYFDDEDIDLEVPLDRYTLSEELQDLISERIKTHNNMAQAQMKIKVWDSALASLRHVLKLEPNNEKALYRKAKVLMEKGNNEEAVGVLKRVTRLYADNKQAKADLARALEKRKRNRANEEKLSKKMLGLDSYENEKKAAYTRWSKTMFLIGGVSVVVGIAAVTYNKFMVY